jgi:Yip1 domain
MDIVKRVRNILVIPELEWSTIEQESGTHSYLLSQYVAYLAAIPAAAAFIGVCVIGVSVPGIGTVRAPLFSALLGAVVGYVSNFVVVYAVAMIVDVLAPRFGGVKNFGNALKLTVYSYTPAWLAGIFLLIPGLRFLTILGVYGIYLFWSGFPRLMKVPADTALGYFAIVVVCALVIAFLAGLVLQAALG